jgi:hypothetical protein
MVGTGSTVLRRGGAAAPLLRARIHGTFGPVSERFAGDRERISAREGVAEIELRSVTCGGTLTSARAARGLRVKREPRRVPVAERGLGVRRRERLTGLRSSYRWSATDTKRAAVAGWNGHEVVDRKPGMVPGEEQVGAVLVEETGPLEQAETQVPEQLLGGRGTDVRYAHPLAGAGPATAGDERVYVRVDVELVSERLGHRDHPGAEGLLLAGPHGHQLADGLPGSTA